MCISLFRAPRYDPLPSSFLQGAMNRRHFNGRGGWTERGEGLAFGLEQRSVTSGTTGRWTDEWHLSFFDMAWSD